MSSSQGCLRLLGSSACPAFEGAYVNPSNLSSAFPWMAGISSVAAFDAAVFDYFADPNQFAQTKFSQQLGCSNGTTAALRWQRTVLCSTWTNLERSRSCQALLDGSSLLDSPRMVCQETCRQYATSEISVVNSTTYCPGPDRTAGRRESTLTRDYVACTDWTSLATSNASICVSGSANEGNCGFGSSTSQLCSFCDPSKASPDSCCYNSGTSLGTCGYSLPSLARASSSSIAASISSSSLAARASSSAASLAAINASSSSSGLSGGQIAGIVVGSVVGAFLLLGLLLFFCLGSRRRRKREQQAAFAAATGERKGGHTPEQSTAATTTAYDSYTADAPAPKGDRKSWFSGGTGGAGAGSSTSVAAGAAALGVPLGAALAPSGHRDAGGGDGLIRPGQVVSALWAYQSSLPDELDLRPGQMIRVSRLFDDAWAFGEFVDGPQSGRQGAFPLVCVTVNGQNASNPAASRTSIDSVPRGSSLRGTSLIPSQDDRDSVLDRPESPLDPYDDRR